MPGTEAPLGEAAAWRPVPLAAEVASRRVAVALEAPTPLTGRAALAVPEAA